MGKVSFLRVLFALCFLFSAYTKFIAPGYFEITLMDQGIASSRNLAGHLSSFYRLRNCSRSGVIISFLHAKITVVFTIFTSGFYGTFNLFMEHRKHRKLWLFRRNDFDDPRRIYLQKQCINAICFWGIY